MRCTACGTMLPTTARFCSRCGTPVITSVSPPDTNGDGHSRRSAFLPKIVRATQADRPSASVSRRWISRPLFLPAAVASIVAIAIIAAVVAIYLRPGSAEPSLIPVDSLRRVHDPSVNGFHSADAVLTGSEAESFWSPSDGMGPCSIAVGKAIVSKVAAQGLDRDANAGEGTGMALLFSSASDAARALDSFRAAIALPDCSVLFANSSASSGSSWVVFRGELAGYPGSTVLVQYRNTLTEYSLIQDGSMVDGVKMYEAYRARIDSFATSVTAPGPSPSATPAATLASTPTLSPTRAILAPTDTATPSPRVVHAFKLQYRDPEGNEQTVKGTIFESQIIDDRGDLPATCHLPVVGSAQESFRISRVDYSVLDDVRIGFAPEAKTLSILGVQYHHAEGHDYGTCGRGPLTGAGSVLVWEQITFTPTVPKPTFGSDTSIVIAGYAATIVDASECGKAGGFFRSSECEFIVK